MESNSAKVFHVTATRVDDRWCVWESDIRGLFLETDSWFEMKDSMESMIPMLLMENHDLKEIDLNNVVVRVKVRNGEEKPIRTSGKVTIVFEQEQILTVT